MKLTDPGKGKKDRQKRKEKRIQTWKIPKSKTAKEAAFQERKADWEVQYVGNLP